MKNHSWAGVPVLSRWIRMSVTGLTLAAWIPFGIVTPALAQSCTTALGHSCHLVVQSVVELPITRDELGYGLPGGTTIESVAGSRYGQLRFEPPVGMWDTVYFKPAPDFWSVGLDRLTVRTSVGVKTLLLVAGDYRHHVLMQNFEGSDLTGIDNEDPGFRFDLVSDAAFGGTQGLRVLPSESDAWVTTPFPVPPDGDGQQGQHTEVGICPPEGAGPVGDPGLPDGEPGWDTAVGPAFTVLEGRLGSNSAYAIAMRRQPGGYGLKAAAADGDSTESPDGWVEIAPGPHRVAARWWTTTTQAGLQVLVDDRMAQALVLPVAGAVEDHTARLGMIGTPADAPEVDFDELVVAAGLVQQGMEPIRVDDFEDEVLDGWALQSPLQLRTAANAVDDGWTGDWHLAVDLPAPALVLDDSPVATERFSVRFWLDARALSGPTNGSVKILDVRSGDNAQGGTRHLKLSVVLDGEGSTSLVVRALADPAKGTWAVADSVPLTNNIGTVVVEWRRSYQVVDTGYVRLWVDGALVTELAGLANHTQAFGSYRLGAINSSPGVVGTVGFDNVVTWEPAPTN